MNTASVINQLKKGGYSVKIRHRRGYNDGTDYPWDHLYTKQEALDNNLSSNDLINNMGETTVNIYKNNKRIATGDAVVGVKDNYCRKFGLQLALQRALNELNSLKYS